MGAKAKKERLDKLLMDRGLCESRAQAQSLILSGDVLVAEQVVDKPGTLIPETALIRVKAQPKYVSRGGLKLEKALADFQIPVTGRVALDAGASSGGFTDCLLQHGVCHVHAVDVGYGQLDWKLRQDARVTVCEKTHVAHLDPHSLDPSPDLAVIDVSFISLKKVLPNVVACLAGSDSHARKDIVALVKPQFEYKDYCAMRGFKGVVSDPKDHETILTALARDIAALLPDWQLAGVTDSPIRGPKGNREFFFALRTPADDGAGENRLDEAFFTQIHRLVFEES